MTPQRLGRYEILGEVARGGMGVVYRGRDPRSGEPVAVKLLLPERVSDVQRRRFQREAEALTRLRAPGVVGLREVGEAQGRPFLVLDWVEGESLQDRLDREGALPPRSAAELIAQLARSLEQVHAAGIVHRDLKPANVLLSGEGRPLLSDFGLGKDLSTAHSLTRTGVFMGTPGYWPPEQAAGDLERVGPRSDVYGLGATLYALLTRMPPIRGRTLSEVAQATAQQRPEPPSRVAADVDAGLERICLRCLSKDPAARYPSAAALAEALEGWLAKEPGGGGARSRRSLAALVGLATLVGAAALGALALRGLAHPDTARRPGTPAPTSPAAEVAPVSTRAARVAELLEQARAAQERGDWEGSLKPLDALLELEPKHEEALYRRGEAYWETEDAIHCLVDWGHAGEGSGDFALKGATRLGSVLVEAQAAPGAIKQLQRALELDPQHLPARRALGEAYYLSQDYEAALAQLDWVLARQPDDVHALYVRGEVYVATRQLEQARADLDRALELEPGNWWARYQRTSAELLSGDIQGALADSEQLVKLKPEEGIGWASLATARYNLDDVEGTREAATRAIELNPKWHQGWLMRGEVRQREGNLEGALSDMNQAVKNGYGEPELYVIRAELRRAMGDERGAIQDLSKARGALPAGSSRRGEVEAELQELQRSQAQATPAGGR